MAEGNRTSMLLPRLVWLPDSCSPFIVRNNILKNNNKALMLGTYNWKV